MQICYIPKLTVSHQAIQSGQFRSIFSENTLQLAPIFFMDLIIFFGKLDGSQSFHLFSYFKMARNCFAQDGGIATTMFIIARFCLNFSKTTSSDIKARFAKDYGVDNSYQEVRPSSDAELFMSRT